MLGDGERGEKIPIEIVARTGGIKKHSMFLNFVSASAPAAHIQAIKQSSSTSLIEQGVRRAPEN